LRGALVTAEGGFEADTWRSTGITYEVQLDSSADSQIRLVRVVDEVAEIPKSLRARGPVRLAM